MINLYHSCSLPVYSQHSNHSDSLKNKLYYANPLFNALYCLPLLLRIKVKVHMMTAKSCMLWHPLTLWPYPIACFAMLTSLQPHWAPAGPQTFLFLSEDLYSYSPLCIFRAHQSLP